MNWNKNETKRKRIFLYFFFINAQKFLSEMLELQSRMFCKIFKEQVHFVYTIESITFS